MKPFAAAWIVGLAGVAASLALAAGAEPAKARKVSGSLVTAYEECPLGTTDSFHEGGIQACTTPVRSDPNCDFGPTGSGSFSFFVKGKGDTVDIWVSARFKGLGAGCEGQELQILPWMRLTSDGCPSGVRCTARDIREPDAVCTVVNGGCKTSTHLDIEYTGAVQPGRNLAFELLSVEIKRGSLVTFRSGLAVR